MELKDIKELIEFDETTTKAVKDVHKKKEEAIKAIAIEKAQIEKDIWDEANKKLKQTKDELDLKIANDAENNEADYRRMSTSFKETFQENKDTWKKELFNRCIK